MQIIDYCIDVLRLYVRIHEYTSQCGPIRYTFNIFEGSLQSSRQSAVYKVFHPISKIVNQTTRLFIHHRLRLSAFAS